MSVVLFLDKKDIESEEEIFIGYIEGSRWNESEDPRLSRSHRQPNRIYSINGTHPTISSSETQGRYYIMEITEPLGCAMRGRNPENPSERGRSNGKYKQRIEMGSNISNTITSVQKDSLVAEPQILTPKRTDFGKQVRKQYEAGELDMSRHDMTELEPRKDGISNTLTSVQKDNLVAEPLQIKQATKQGYIEIPPGSVFDASYPDSQTRRGRVQDGGQTSPTLMASGEAPCYYEGVSVHPNSHALEFKGETSIKKDASPALRATDYKCPHVVWQKEPSYRIRKLTPRECFRLMGVTEENIDKIQQSGVSQSQQYKMAGNSIVVDCLFHLFRKMFTETENESNQMLLF